jgi:branched-chain amino acid transport system permease protein
VDLGFILEQAIRSLFSKDAVVYALAGIGLNLHFGYTGLLNFGQIGFVAIGAYGIGMAVFTFGIPIWFGVPLGILGAVILALLLGLPTLRLRADYLAIVTIAASEIIRLVFRSVSMREITGGSNGINGFADTFYAVNPLSPGNYGPLQFNERATWVLGVGWLLVIFFALLIFLMMRSPWGRVLKAIREDEDAARSLGKNVYAYKMQSLVIGGVIGAFAGFINGLATQSVQPDAYSTQFTFFVYAAIILGGAATLFGPILGSMLFWAILSISDTLLRQLVGAGYVSPSIMSGTQIGQVRFMLVGLGLVALMTYRPQGLLGNKKEMALDAG